LRNYSENYDSQSGDRSFKSFKRLLLSAKPNILPTPEFEEKLLSRMMDKLDTLERHQAAKVHIIQRRKWLRIRIPAAAALAAAFLIAGFCWFIAKGPSVASADFGNMLQHVRQADTVAFRSICAFPEVKNSEVLMSRPGRIRAEWSDGSIHIIDRPNNRLAILTPTKKRVSVRSSWEFTFYEPLDVLLRTAESAGQFMGKDKCEGRQALVYRVEHPQGVMRVWVDAKEELPLRIESWSSMSDKGKPNIVLENFRWNVPIPDSAFALKVPPGYALEKLEDNPSEESLRSLLAIVAQMSDGTFPVQLNVETISTLAFSTGQLHKRMVDSDKTATTGSGEAKETYRTCLRGLAFVKQANKNGTWRYVGQGVKLGDASAVICWWRNPQASNYRVVYGDLRIEDCEESRLPRQKDNH
jgi:outer membrane lipoprotein-sorting protein